MQKKKKKKVCIHRNTHNRLRQGEETQRKDLSIPVKSSGNDLEACGHKDESKFTDPVSV